MRELAILLRNEGTEAEISTPHSYFSISILLLSQSKKLRELRPPVVQTCNILRQLIYTEKQIISTLKTQSLDFKTWSGKHHLNSQVLVYSDLQKCLWEKLIWVWVWWNRERSDTYRNRRFPKCMTCMHVPLQVGCIHWKHPDTNPPAQQPAGRYMHTTDCRSGAMCLPPAFS